MYRKPRQSHWGSAAVGEPGGGPAGGHFGPHNLHENRTATFQSSEIIFATYQNAGLRVFDIRDPFRPAEIAAYVPSPLESTTAPSRPIQSTDVFVDRRGLVYVTDVSHGLTILEFEH